MGCKACVAMETDGFQSQMRYISRDCGFYGNSHTSRTQFSRNN